VGFKCIQRAADTIGLVRAIKTAALCGACVNARRRRGRSASSDGPAHAFAPEGRVPGRWVVRAGFEKSGWTPVQSECTRQSWTYQKRRQGALRLAQQSFLAESALGIAPASACDSNPSRHGLHLPLLARVRSGSERRLVLRLPRARTVPARQRTAVRSLKSSPRFVWPRCRCSEELQP
jgi:hypothetical protein